MEGKEKERKLDVIETVEQKKWKWKTTWAQTWMRCNEIEFKNVMCFFFITVDFSTCFYFDIIFTLEFALARCFMLNEQCSVAVLTPFRYRKKISLLFCTVFRLIRNMCECLQQMSAIVVIIGVLCVLVSIWNASLWINFFVLCCVVFCCVWRFYCYVPF